MPYRLLPGLLGSAALSAMLLSAPLAHAAIEFTVTNLVSDGSVPAAHIDPGLKNPWGVSHPPGGPFWISDNATHKTTLYDGSGAPITRLPQVMIQPSDSAPTGQVFNAGAAGGAFKINGATPFFLFAGEDGHIAGWSPSFGTSAHVGFTTSNDAVFKGLALATNGPDTHLFAADFHNNAVEMFTNNFDSFTTFTDPTVAAGFAPFNTQLLDGKLYVTFAKQDADAHDDVAGAGNGYVDVFNLDGTLDHRIASLGDELNSPWGLAIAPANWGAFAGKLLVGNFGDGSVSVFDQNGGGFLGKLLGTDGKPLIYGDLWALISGAGALGADPNSIYFTAGLKDESEGLFGRISVATVPEPTAWALMIGGFGLMGATLRARRRRLAPAD